MDEIRLLNYLKGELSEEEILQVEAWYEASPDNKKMLDVYWRACGGDGVC